MLKKIGLILTLHYFTCQGNPFPNYEYEYEGEGYQEENYPNCDLPDRIAAFYNGKRKKMHFKNKVDCGGKIWDRYIISGEIFLIIPTLPPLSSSAQLYSL